jgi:phage portal protein BeeE
MGFWSRFRGRTVEERMSVDDWANLFSFGGLEYPLLQTTMGNLNEEQIAATATAAFESNGPVFALVLARLQVFSQVRFQWSRFQGGQPGDLFGSPELSLLERPWPGGTTSDLLARMEMDASLAGNSYTRRTSRTRLNRLRPDWVTIVLGSNEDADHPGEAADVEVAGYIYKPGNGRAIYLLPHEVAHYAPVPDPDSNFLGMSWISPVIRDVQADNLQNEYKRAFLKNSSTPNMAIKFDPKITTKQIREYKELLESEHRGAANAWKTLYLGGGADPMVIGKDFRELDFAVTQGKGESRLASAAGVPPSWVGFSEGLQGSSLNAGNFTAARRRFSDGTLHHLWGNAAASLETIIHPPDSGAQLWYSTAGVPFLKEDAQSRADIQSKQMTTIVGYVRDGFAPESAVAAVMNDDPSLLVHTNLLSVQLQPPGQITGVDDDNG